MLFNSLQFLLFFPIVLIIYFIIPNKIKYIWLLVASYYFYMSWNPKYVLLIMTSTVITYTSGILIENVKNKEIEDNRKQILQKVVVALSFISNLGVLFYYKYINFALGVLTAICKKVNIVLNIPSFDIILPVGISFYTFQALSYTMDVYRDEIYAEKNFFKYALFVSFFPQLVAGPIERSKNLLKQISKPRKLHFEGAKEGVLLMLGGYFLKIVIADRIAIFVDTVYGDYEMHPGFYLIVATMLFAMQIYCDFAGYSTIAVGAAKILGIELMENFDAPYISISVAEFWRKWHISLTSWFKDYLYIPLGGSRKGKLRKFTNKLVVFLISGLWHGASFSFVVWGGLNGIYQILGELMMPLRNKAVKTLQLQRESFGHKLIHVIGTFILVDFSWIFFRAVSTKQAFCIIKSMLTVHNPWIMFDGSLYDCGLNQKNFQLMLICLIILLIKDIFKEKKISLVKKIVNQDAWFQILFISFSVVLIILLGVWGGEYDPAGFLYFQF